MYNVIGASTNNISELYIFTFSSASSYPSQEPWEVISSFIFTACPEALFYFIIEAVKKKNLLQPVDSIVFLLIIMDQITSVGINHYKSHSSSWGEKLLNIVLKKHSSQGRILVVTYHLLDLELYDSNNSISAMMVTIITRTEHCSLGLAKTLFFTFLYSRYSCKFILKAFPQHLIENPLGPPVWTSIFISLTGSCSLQ